MKPLEILCFGDSLTLGFQSPTSRNPNVQNIAYGIYLQKYLGEHARVRIRGICGETTQDMRQRFQKEAFELKPHYVIILGGTNDLGWGIEPTIIMDNLSALYAQAKQQGIQPIAVTVPSIGSIEDRGALGFMENSYMESNPVSSAITARIRLNNFMKEVCTEQNIAVVDLFTETCDPQTKRLAAEYSNDGLHLTTAGYQKLAELLWIQVFSGREQAGV